MNQSPLLTPIEGLPVVQYPVKASVAAATNTIVARIPLPVGTLVYADGVLLFNDATGGDSAAYSFKVAAKNLIGDRVAATTTLTSNNTNVANNVTVTIGNKTYTFKTALTPTEGEVLIGADADGSLLNLIRAINHTGTPDTDYKCAAAHTQVTAAASVTAHAFVITSRLTGTIGNAYATSDSSATLSWTDTVMTGGVDGCALIGAISLTALEDDASWSVTAGIDETTQTLTITAVPDGSNTTKVDGWINTISRAVNGI